MVLIFELLNDECFPNTFALCRVEEEDDLPETVNVNLNVGGTQMHDHEGGIVMVPPSM